MASSRIFVKGLPPTLTDVEFRKHFSSQREITDAKIFPSRRIGYVGYKTPEDAQKAVKYYNRTFIRMSKIGVEIARPVQDSNPFKQSGSAPTARRASDGDDGAREQMGQKRKREGEEKEEDDPKLKEYLDVMKPKRKKKAWKIDEEPAEVHLPENGKRTQVEEGQSDEEYEDVPKKTKRPKQPSESLNGVPQQTQEVQESLSENDANEPKPVNPETPLENQPPASDSDWARSRTSRLLGLLDDNEEEEAAANRLEAAVSKDSDDDSKPEKGISKVQDAKDVEISIPTPPSDVPDDTHIPLADANVDQVRASMRLFVRNLPYHVKAEDLETEFEAFGNLEGVRIISHFPTLS